MTISNKKTPSDSSELRERSAGAVTLEDVAKIVGVSSITVSRALNHPEQVANKTLVKINRAIADTGYIPNLLAGGLASKKSKLIAAIVPSLANSVYSETVQLFKDKLQEAGYQVLMGESGFSEKDEEVLVTSILSHRPAGILLTGVDHSPNCKRLLMAANIPLVETWDITSSPIDAVIGFSHEIIGKEVANYLLNKGYRKIGIISANDYRAQRRKRAFIETLSQNGVENIAESILPVPTSLKLGRDGLAKLIDDGFTDGAVFCSSDNLAQGALIEAQARGIAIPEKIAIIGFGDQPFAKYLHPPLTSVRFDRKAIGIKAAEILLARINGEVIEERVIDIGFTIVGRGTL